MLLGDVTDWVEFGPGEEDRDVVRAAREWLAPSTTCTPAPDRYAATACIEKTTKRAFRSIALCRLRYDPRTRAYLHGASQRA